MAGHRSVTIEGTLMPAAGVLPRGERTTVAYTDRIAGLVARGHIKIIEFHDEQPELTDTEREADYQAAQSRVEADLPAQPGDDEKIGNRPEGDTEVPKRNASREEWGYFLETQGVDIDDDASRDELIAVWDGLNGDD